MVAEIRRLQKENEYLKRQREIPVKKAMSILGEEPNPGMHPHQAHSRIPDSRGNG
jgi:hypothetical protein